MDREEAFELGALAGVKAALEQRVPRIDGSISDQSRSDAASTVSMPGLLQRLRRAVVEQTAAVEPGHVSKPTRPPVAITSNRSLASSVKPLRSWSCMTQPTPPQKPVPNWEALAAMLLKIPPRGKPATSRRTVRSLGLWSWWTASRRAMTTRSSGRTDGCWQTRGRCANRSRCVAGSGSGRSLRISPGTYGSRGV